MFSKERNEDKELMHELKESKSHEKKEHKKKSKKHARPKNDMEKLEHKFKKARLKGRSEMPKRKKGY